VVCLANPKYDGDESGYGKVSITVVEEGTKKMKATMRVVEVIMEVEECYERK
jgi:hypothetical protein